jgi:hypothetical protein
MSDWSDRPDRRIFKTCGKSGKFTRNLRRGLHTNKDAGHPRCGILIRSCQAGLVREVFAFASTADCLFAAPMELTRSRAAEGQLREAARLPTSGE